MIPSSTRLRVLSIQSHVVHGYVGNRSAVFPLQVCGIEVDYINSVEFSNHTGYGSVKGSVSAAKDLQQMYEGLKMHKLCHYTHILTGYVGCPSFLTAVADIIRDLKSKNPNLKYYCDPVLGDAGNLVSSRVSDGSETYVPPELVPIYKDKILPLADAIFPNQFEAELLSGSKIIDEKSAIKAIDLLHEIYNIPTVIITSTDICLDPSATASNLVGYASQRFENLQSGDLLNSGSHGPTASLNFSHSEVGNPSSRGNFERIRLVIPFMNDHFTGTGDLFAALTLARLEMNPITKSSFVDAFNSVISTMQAVLKRTLKMVDEEKARFPFLPKSALIELKLVQSLDDIRNPKLGSYVQPI